MVSELAAGDVAFTVTLAHLLVDGLPLYAAHTVTEPLPAPDVPNVAVTLVEELAEIVVEYGDGEQLMAMPEQLGVTVTWAAAVALFVTENPALPACPDVR